MEYFEASCSLGGHKGAMVRSGVAPRAVNRHHHLAALHLQNRHLHQRQKHLAQYPAPAELPRSHKIESLIKRVVEKESRDRLRSAAARHAAAATSSQRLQVCDGIVRSKLPIFDVTKRQGPRLAAVYDQKGLVKSKLAIFDGGRPTAAAAAVYSSRKLRKETTGPPETIVKEEKKQR